MVTVDGDRPEAAAWADKEAALQSARRAKQEALAASK